MTEETAPEVNEQVSDSLLDTPPTTDFSTKPEDMPDDFWDAEKNGVNVDALYKAFQNRDKISKDLRVKLSRGEFEGKPPEDVKEYVLELDENLKQIVPDDDRLLIKAREAAKEAGLPKDVFNKFMTPIVQELAALQSEMMQPPSEEEIAAARDAEIAKLGQGGQKIISVVGDFLNKLHASGTLSDAELATAKSMATSADAVKVFNKLRTLNGNYDKVPLDLPVDSASSRSEIEKKLVKAFETNNKDDYEKYSAMLTKFI